MRPWATTRRSHAAIENHAAADRVAMNLRDRHRVHAIERVSCAQSQLATFAPGQPRPMRRWSALPGGRSLRSAPAEKARPAPLTITTRKSWWVSNQRAASASSRSIVAPIAFSLSGQLGKGVHGAIDFDLDRLEFTRVTHGHALHSLLETIGATVRCDFELPIATQQT